MKDKKFKILKPKWHCMPQSFKIFENEDLFSEKGIKSMVCKVFINEDTGETKFFAKFVVDKIGEDAILKKLNRTI